MPDVPPKQPVTGVESVKIDQSTGLSPVGDSVAQTAEPYRQQVDPLPSAGIVAVHGGASQLSPEAFPVLKAFQEYLESERQRANRRVIVLSCIFSAVILCVLGAFVMIYLKAQDRQDSLLQTVIAQASQQQNQPQQIVVQQPTPQQPSVQEITTLISDAIAKDRQAQNAIFEQKLSAYSHDLEAAKTETAALKSELEKAKQAQAKAVEEAKSQTTATAQPAQPRQPATPSAQEPATAAKPSAQSASAATAPAAPTPAAAAKPASDTPAATAPGQKPAASAQPPKLEIPKYPSPPPPDGFTSGSMTIKTGKTGKPVSWRVYVPER